MPRKRRALPYKKNRSLISDVLPYEVPLSFSNQYFLDFVSDYGIEFGNEKLSWAENSEATDWIIRSMFGVPDSVPLLPEEGSGGDDRTRKKCVSLKKQLSTIPFTYKISNKKSGMRDLSVPHPQAQLRVVDFYDRFKELIICFCSTSEYSIRRPVHVAKRYFHKDRTHFENLSNDPDAIELDKREYQNLRSFFAYRDYSIIHKFYESYRYLRSEKKYNKLRKLDISKCFDSVYTHSISWAIFGKDAVKYSLRESRNSFAGQFDSLMQGSNHSETNGIIIGPEFSRIFAELILQSVDREVERELRDSRNIIFKKHYEIFRYVDDYFVFYNDDSVVDKVTEILEVALKKYKFSLNTEKTVTYEKPIITELSRAKRRVADLLESTLTFRPNDEDEDEGSADKGEFSGYVNSKSLITHFKTLVFETGVEYRDIVNYSLSIVERKVETILKSYGRSDQSEKSTKRLTDVVVAILEFSFFIYSAVPRVNSTIKLCLLLRTLIPFFKAANFNRDTKHFVLKYIFDEVTLVLKMQEVGDNTQVETLYLLICLRELGKEYWLDESSLLRYFGLGKNDGGEYTGGENLNYFSISVLLFYMREKVKYEGLRQHIEEVIVSKVNDKRSTRLKDAETIFLIFDTISCPFVSRQTKQDVLKIMGVTRARQDDIINLRRRRAPQKRQLYFTNWDEFDFGKALDAKRGHEVY